MSVQWWLNGKRASFEDVVEASKRGVIDRHGTVPARNGRPTVYAVPIKSGGKTLIECREGRSGMMHTIYEITHSDPIEQLVVSSAMLMAIDWEREEAAKAAKEEES